LGKSSAGIASFIALMIERMGRGWL
jgi:hypothetical protein